MFKKKNKDKNEQNNQIIFLRSLTDYHYFSNLLKTKNNNPPKKKFHLIKRDITINFNGDKNIVGNEINLADSNTIILDKKNKKEEIIKKSKKIMSYNDEELNQLAYQSALKFDKRTFCVYYISLLKLKHNIIFSFIYTKDYNSRIIKIDLFFLSFIIYFGVNALFFNDTTMHKIYEDQGSFNLVYQLPQIVYSSLISFVLNLLLKLLALSEGNILSFKEKKEKRDLEKREKDLKKILDIKFILYFILSTILLLFLWYYLSMFCAIYKKTQYHLIKDTLISFGFSLLYPFGIYLLPGIFRIPSLSDPKNKRNYLYSISKLFQLL